MEEGERKSRRTVQRGIKEEGGLREDVCRKVSSRFIKCIGPTAHLVLSIFYLA